jgi:hypothetical protein
MKIGKWKMKNEPDFPFWTMEYEMLKYSFKPQIQLKHQILYWNVINYVAEIRCVWWISKPKCHNFRTGIVAEN